MTRIIAGSAGGRRLQVPPKGTRPTSDRVRESCFSSLESTLLAEGRSWSELSVLDLYAGSGALGLEALSRGARFVTLVENSSGAVRILRGNVTSVGLAGARVLAGDASRLPPASGSPEAPAELVFVDPPYDVAAPAVQRTLENAAQAGWIADRALVVVERSARDRDTPLPSGWICERTKTFGDTALWYGRAAIDEPHGSPG